MFAKIIAGWEETVINITFGLLCRHPGFTSEIYGHLARILSKNPIFIALYNVVTTYFILA